MRERRVGEVTVLELSGRLTLGEESMRLKDKINSLLHQGARNILIDLGGVTYIDSTGLGELVSSFTSVKRHEGRLKLFNLGKRSKDLLVMTKLIMVFETFDNEEDALASFN
jgi:anti-sigma B factor antagonist